MRDTWKALLRKCPEDKISALAGALDLLHDAVLVRDMQGRVLYLNQGFELLTGCTAHEVLGKEIQDFLQIDPIAENAAARILPEKGAWRGELKMIARTGRQLTTMSRCSVLRNSQGEPDAILLISADITDQKELEAQFQRAQRLQSIGRLAGGVAHDLNNILGAMMMLLPTLREAIDDRESLALLDILESSTQRGADVVKRILMFSRGVAEKKAPVQSRQLLNDFARIVDETFPKSITLQTSIERDLWLVQADAAQLLQVLMNLCVNARDAMPKGGILTLAARNVRVSEVPKGGIYTAKPGAYVCWRVSDTGSGIPPEYLARIFDPFFTTKEIGKGTGLGLFSVQKIIRSHGGFIEVESALGTGTDIFVYLPASVEVSLELRNVPAAIPPGRGESILLVDDEEGVRSLYQKAFEKSGYRVLVAAEGRQALEIFRKSHSEINAVMTDIMMPRMDGVTLVEKLRKIRPEMKVIATTGLASDPLVTAAGGLGLNALLQKPFTLPTLLRTVRNVLDELGDPVLSRAQGPSCEVV